MTDASGIFDFVFIRLGIRKHDRDVGGSDPFCPELQHMMRRHIGVTIFRNINNHKVISIYNRISVTCGHERIDHNVRPVGNARKIGIRHLNSWEQEHARQYILTFSVPNFSPGFEPKAYAASLAPVR